jgi:hypothetical protein
VLINVECPICGNKYQLRPDMLGKRMRCTNPTCRAVFEVQESAPPPLQPTRPAARPLPDSAARPLAQQPTPQAKSPAASPSVPAPSLPAPSVPPPSLPAPQVADWATAPPPVQRPSASVSASTPAAAPDANAFTPAAPLPTTPPRPNQPRVSVPAHSPATVERAAPAQQQSSRPESSAPSEPPVDPLPPPVVRDYAEPAVDAEPSSDRLPLPEMRPAKRGGGRAVLLALVAVLLLALVGVGAGVYFLARPAGEVERFEQAKKDFESRKYTDAARSFAKLAEDFASHREEYRLLADLATLRSETDSILFDPERAIAAYRAVRDHPADAANQTRHRIWIWEAAVQLVGKVTQRAEEQAAQKDFSAATALAAQVEALLDELPTLPKVEQMQEQIDQLRQRHTALARQIARGRALADLLGQLQALLNENPTQEKIEQGLALARAAGFDGVPQVRRLLDDARRQVRTSVRFVQSPLPPITPLPEPSLTSLVVVPPLAGQAVLGTEPRTTEASGPRSGTPSVVYAVARGVVYGLSGSDGRLLWMTRVGLDGATLPVTVPSSAVGREMTLLLVEAGTALRAVDPTTGAVQWQQPLGGTAVGRPLLVGRRVYVAVRDQRPGRAEHGKLYEFSVIDGHRIGWLETGQALAGGITRHGNTGLLFCPAESERVYVINVDHIEPDGQRRPQCIDVLETAHPAGSLRSELVVAGAELHGGDSETPELSWPRYLLLPQADGPEHDEAALLRAVAGPAARPAHGDRLAGLVVVHPPLRQRTAGAGHRRRPPGLAGHQPTGQQRPAPVPVAAYRRSVRCPVRRAAIRHPAPSALSGGAAGREHRLGAAGWAIVAAGQSLRSAGGTEVCRTEQAARPRLTPARPPVQRRRQHDLSGHAVGRRQRLPHYCRRCRAPDHPLATPTRTGPGR